MKKILVAAGGTGGHLFPAIAVVEKLKELQGDEIDFQFFGRTDKIEGRIVPELGYKLHSTNLTGLVKTFSLNTFKLPFQILHSVNKLRKIIKQENIDAVLCAGAYLSYPAGLAGSMCKKKLFLMESNVNPGKAINWLSSRADVIFTTFDETKNYFNEVTAKKIKLTGNPVRKQILNEVARNQAIEKFGLNKEKSVVLIFGGSLGAAVLNNAVLNSLERFAKSDFQVIWQTGEKNSINIPLPDNVKLVNFIDDMASAYSAADLVVSRSGATTAAELCIVGKPSILVPLPSASNNEQYFNAKYLESHNAAILITNNKISEKMYSVVTDLLLAPQKLNQMAVSAKHLAKPNASEIIAKEILNCIL